MMTNSTEISTAPRRERTLTRWIIVVIVAALALAVLQSAFAGDVSPGRREFLRSIRADHPELSISVASDQALVDVARSTCTPEGISDSEASWLHRIGVDVDEFTESAQVLCPTR